MKRRRQVKLSFIVPCGLLSAGQLWSECVCVGRVFEVGRIVWMKWSIRGEWEPAVVTTQGGLQTHTNTLNVSLLHTWFHSVRSLCTLGKQIIMDDYECWDTDGMLLKWNCQTFIFLVNEAEIRLFAITFHSHCAVCSISTDADKFCLVKK